MCAVAESETMIRQLLDEDILIPVVAIVMGCSVGVIAIIAGAMTKIFVSRSREATKREMAAYVAEGSIEADKAIAMLTAGTNASEDA